MAERLQLYKCENCGNIVLVMHGGTGQLVCCNKPMILQVPNTVDAAVEKHVPVIEKHGDACASWLRGYSFTSVKSAETSCLLCTAGEDNSFVVISLWFYRFLTRLMPL